MSVMSLSKPSTSDITDVSESARLIPVSRPSDTKHYHMRMISATRAPTLSICKDILLEDIVGLTGLRGENPCVLARYTLDFPLGHPVRAKVLVISFVLYLQ